MPRSRSVAPVALVARRAESATSFVVLLPRIIERIEQVVDHHHRVQVDGLRSVVALAHPVIDFAAPVTITRGSGRRSVERFGVAVRVAHLCSTFLFSASCS